MGLAAWISDDSLLCVLSQIARSLVSAHSFEILSRFALTISNSWVIHYFSLDCAPIFSLLDLHVGLHQFFCESFVSYRFGVSSSHFLITLRRLQAAFTAPLNFLTHWHPGTANHAETRSTSKRSKYPWHFSSQAGNPCKCLQVVPLTLHPSYRHVLEVKWDAKPSH